MKEYIIKKLKEIESVRTNLIGNLNALSGAEQAWKEMLAHIESEETKTEGEAPNDKS